MKTFIITMIFLMIVTSWAGVNEVMVLEKTKLQMINEGNIEGAWILQQQIDKQAPKMGPLLQKYEGSFDLKYRDHFTRTISIKGGKCTISTSSFGGIGFSNRLKYLPEFDGYVWQDDSTAKATEVFLIREGVLWAVRYSDVHITPTAKTVSNQLGMSRIGNQQTVTTAKIVSTHNLQIVSAVYGAENHWIDVTDKIKSQVQDGMLTVAVVTKSLTETDPLFGHVKELKINYKYDGQLYTTSAKEFQTVVIPTGVQNK